MQQAVGARDINKGAVHRDVRSHGSRIVNQLNPGHGPCVETVDQDPEIGSNDVSLGCVGREEKVNGMESAVTNIDVGGRKGYGRVRWDLPENNWPRTKRRKVWGSG